MRYQHFCPDTNTVLMTFRLFEFHLLVDTSFESTDVLGLGECQGEYSGVMYGIISLETATDWWWMMLNGFVSLLLGLGWMVIVLGGLLPSMISA